MSGSGIVIGGGGEADRRRKELEAVLRIDGVVGIDDEEDGSAHVK